MRSTHREPSTLRLNAIGAVLAVALMLLNSTAEAFVPPPETADLLFVANGYFSNEERLEDHFDDLGYNVVRTKDSAVTSSTGFSSFDLVVVTGFAPNIGTSAMNALLASGVPVLAISYWNQAYAKKLGLVTTNNAEYYGGKAVDLDVAEPASFARYVGQAPTVYSSSYTMYGALVDQVSSEVKIVARHGSDLDLIVAMYNGATRRAALGAYDAERYTVDGWRLLDLLLYRLAPPGPSWGSSMTQAQGFIDSGLASYVAQVAADPRAFSVDEVRTTVWNRLLSWNLLPLWEQAIAPLPGPVLDDWWHLEQDLFFSTKLPKIHHPRCGHPKDKWFAGQAWMDIPDGPDPDTDPDGCTAQYYPDCPHCQVYDEGPTDIENISNLDAKGPYWPTEARKLLTDDEYKKLNEAVTTVRKSYYLRGTDMGASVQLGDVTYFYMGDTWGFDPACTDNNAWACPSSIAVKNDAILTSTDNDYADGVDAIAPLAKRNDARLGFTAMGVGGVHYGIEPGLDDFWQPISTKVPVEPRFTTTGSAFTMTQTWTVTMPPPFVSIPVSLQTVVVNYNTASQGVADGQVLTPSFLVSDHTGGWNVCTLTTRDCTVPLARKNPRSLMGCSLDGVHFNNCYQYRDGFLNSNPPFSKDGFEFTVCGAQTRSIKWTDKSRFAGFAAVQFTADDFELVCNWNDGIEPESDLCAFDGSGGGVLLYGKPRPAGSGPLTLAFLAREDFGEVWKDGTLQGRPKAFFYAGPGKGVFGSSWHWDEEYTAPLPLDDWTDGFPCDEDKMNAKPNGVIPYYDPALDEAFATTKFAIATADNTKVIPGIGLTLAQYNEQVLGITKNDALAWTDWHYSGFRADIDGALLTLNAIKDVNNHSTTPQEKAFATFWYNPFLAFKTFARYRDCSASAAAPRYTPETCLLTETQRAQTSAVASVRIVREPNSSEPIILLFGGNKYRWAPLEEPWNVSSPISVNKQVDWNDNELTNDVEGYGTFILPGEQALYYEQTGSNGPDGTSSGILHVYHAVSTWGDNNTKPYGVYTRETLISWPPPQFFQTPPPPPDSYIRPYLYVTPAVETPWPSYDEVEFDRIMRSIVAATP